MYDVTLQNGVSMPVLGLGVYKTRTMEEMQHAVDSAVDAGYRSFDTAQMYQNEELLGAALAHASISRNDMFITSKIDLPNMSRDGVAISFAESLKKLQTVYLDLLLVHWPGQQPLRLQEVWAAIEDLYDQKKVRAIGVCNCTEKHLDWIRETCRILPMVNQIERQPLLNQKVLFSYCRRLGIQTEAWSPLLRGNFNIPEIVSLTDKYHKTAAQIILRWDIQSGYVVIPKSVHRERIFENAGIFDFMLAEEDMALIDSLDTGYTTGWDLDTFAY